MDNINIDTLTAYEIREWFIKINTDKVRDICDGTNVKILTFNVFLRHSTGENFLERSKSGHVQARGALRQAVELARSYLKRYQSENMN